MFTRLTVLNLTGEKLALWFVALKFVDKHRPPSLTSTLCPPDVINVIGIPRPLPFYFFAALPLPYIILNTNRRTKNGGGMGTRLIVTFIDPIRNTIWYPIFISISSHRGDGISGNSEKINIVVQNIGLHACVQILRRTMSWWYWYCLVFFRRKTFCKLLINQFLWITWTQFTTTSESSLNHAWLMQPMLFTWSLRLLCSLQSLRTRLATVHIQRKVW